MVDVSKLQAAACAAIDSLSSELHHISQEIWSHPELNFNEVFAHNLLTTYLKKKGFSITSGCGGLATAFKAVYSCNSGDHKTAGRVGVVCEYDALPEIGHACGHNLIAEAGIAAAMGIKAAIDASNGAIGELVVLGTPAEEGGGGKIFMLDDGSFDDVDFCMMVHPSNCDIAMSAVLANKKVHLTFHGHAAHAAAFPWQGVNALDAAVACYTSISMLRQQMKPTWKVHGVFEEGGVKPNIIPEKTVLFYYFRAPTNLELELLLKKAKDCWEGAATAAGCTVTVNYGGIGKSKQHYSSIKNNTVLAKLYQKHSESQGVVFLTETEAQKSILGSTDMGNVSLVKPSIHPMFSIGTKHVVHTRAYNSVTCTDDAQPRTLVAGKSMAMTAVEVLCNPKILESIVEEFKQTKDNS